MALIEVAQEKLFEGVVQRLVGVRDQQHALRGKGVEQVGDNLHRRVRLARARRADHHRQPGVHRRAQRLVN